MVLKHYANNIKQEQPSGVINDQCCNEYGKWDFGMLSTMEEGGCGLFALYNLLYRSGANPYLPALIACCELGNADLFFGKLGVNGIDTEDLWFIKENVEALYFGVIAPIISMEVIPVVALEIIAIQLDLTPWWLKIGVVCAAPFEFPSIVTLLESIFLVGSIFIDSILDSMFNNAKTLEDIARIFTKNVKINPCKGLYCLDKAENLYNNVNQFIIGYAHNIDLNFLPGYLSGGGHYIYVERAYNDKGEYGFKVYNLNCNGYEYWVDEFYKVINEDGTRDEARIKMTYIALIG